MYIITKGREVGMGWGGGGCFPTFLFAHGVAASLWSTFVTLAFFVVGVKTLNGGMQAINGPSIHYVLDAMLAKLRQLPLCRWCWKDCMVGRGLPCGTSLLLVYVQSLQAMGETCRNIYTHTHTHTHTYTHAHADTHAHMHAHTHTHTRMHARIHTHTYTHTRMYAHTHARTHTHTNTHQIHTCEWWSWPLIQKLKYKTVLINKWTNTLKNINKYLKT